MDDLVLVGVHDDGEHVLLTNSNGQRFRLRVDEALRAAVRRDRARLGQIQLESEGRLRPREIQARIRAGETAEEVAQAAGVAVEHVRRYEGPVLAEREFVAQQAREVRLRRGSGVGPAGDRGTLGETIAERLAQREVDAEQVSWDAWRNEDGTWMVSLDFSAGSKSRQARWTYDPGVRHVAPMDDEARWLTEEEPPAPAAPPNPANPAARRLAPVRDVFDVEASAPGSAAGRPTPEENVAIELLDTLRERRGRRTRSPAPEGDPILPDPVREAIDSLLSRAEALGDPPAAHPARSRPQDARDGEVLVLPESEPIGHPAGASAGRAGRPAEQAPIVEEPDDDEGATVGARPGARRQQPPRKQRRASVPSWDDIVFGQRRD